MEKASVNAIVTATTRTAKVIFFAIFFQATVFSFWGLQFFMSTSQETPVPLPIYVVFSLMALLSFVYGIRFFQNYIKVRSSTFASMEAKKLKESLLLIYSLQLLLLEFVAVIGIMIAIFTQKPALIYPFYGLFLIGMIFSYPKLAWFEPHFAGKGTDVGMPL